MKKEALRVSTTIPAAPTTLYLAWLNPEQHSAMTGGVAKIDPQVGGKFTAWNGYISGKLVILDLGRRIVMSWRTADFPREASDARVELHFEALGGSTRLTVLHTDIPEGQGAKYREDWNEKYFAPMRNFFSKYLPDPREPPPPRRPPPPIDETETEDGEEEEEKLPKPKKSKPDTKAPLSSKALLSKKAAPSSKALLPKAPLSSKKLIGKGAPVGSKAAKAAQEAPPKPKKATSKESSVKKPSAAPSKPSKPTKIKKKAKKK
jgi:uncharacterized protein YndB with AHSA1/START domain